MKKGKLFLGGIAVLLVLLFGGMVAVGYFGLDYNQGAEYEALQKTVEAELQENGDIVIVETVRYKFNKRDRPHYNPYREFKQYDIEAIKDVAVYDHDEEMWYEFDPSHVAEASLSRATPYTCYLDDRGSTWEIGFIMPAIDKGERTFTMQYTLSGMRQIESYTDCDVLYTMFHPAGTYPVRDFLMTLTFPNAGEKEDIFAWLHCTANSNLTIVDGNTIAVTAQNVPIDVFIEVRMLMPPGSLDLADNVHDWRASSTIRDEEMEWAQGWNALVRYRGAVAVACVGIAFGLVVLAGYVAWRQSQKRRKLEPRMKDAPYVRAAPYAVSAAVAGQFMQQAAVTDNTTLTGKDATGNLLSASTLSLAHKGWLNLGSTDKGKATIFCTGSGNTPPTPEEAELLLLYGEVANSYGGKTYTMKQYKSWFEANTSNGSRHLQLYQSHLNKEVQATGWTGNSAFFASARGWLAVGCAAAALALLLFVEFFGRGILIGGLGIAACIFAISAKSTYLTPEGVTAMEQWKGFFKFLKDFTIVDERTPGEVGLWGDYLVYGTAFGIGDAVSEQLRTRHHAMAGQNMAPDMPADSPAFDPLGHYFYGSYVFGAGSFTDVSGSGGGGGGGSFNPIGSMLGDLSSTGSAISSMGSSSSDGGGGGGSR